MKPNQKYQKHPETESIASTVLQRGSALSNIWIFHSPKNDKRLKIKSDLAFMHCVIWEGDPAVQRYEIEPSIHVNNLLNGEHGPAKIDAIRHVASGKSEWCLFRKEGENKVSVQIIEGAATSVGATCQVFTASQLKSKSMLFDNWLNLCAAMTRAKNQPAYIEGEILASRLQLHQHLTLTALLSEETIDPSVMLGLVARGLSSGLLRTELETQLFGLNSIIERGQS